MINIIAITMLIIFTIFEILTLFKGLTKQQVIIHDLVFEGNDLNKPSLIINNVLLGIGLIGFLSTLISSYFIEKHFFTLISLSPIFLYLLLNCIYYNLYILLDKLIKKDEEKFYLSKK